MNTITLKSPAKLNLYLNVLGKREDGYHEIETVFEAIDLCDQITLTKREGGIEFYCDNPSLPVNRRNLAYKAAEALKRETACPEGVRIEIAKRIPIASGLGGGSSNAASVLLGLNKLWDLGMSKEKLSNIGKELGADIPFFVSQCSTAIGRGIGDELTPIPCPGERYYVVVSPRLEVSTREVYNDCYRIISLTKQDNRTKIFDYNINNLDGKALYNSLEAVVIERFGVVSEIKETLKTLGIRRVLMSGSGPVVFGIARTNKEGIELERKLSALKRGWQVFVAKTYTNGLRKE